MKICFSWFQIMPCEVLAGRFFPFFVHGYQGAVEPPMLE